MKLKEGVSLQGLKIEMRPVLIAADRIWTEYGHELVITSGTEETDKHWAGSLHRFGLALDLRTYYFFDDDEKQKVTDRLGKAMKKVGGYKVILESSHIHVEAKLT